MNVGLKVTYLYHDVDIIEVRVTAENRRFRGSAGVYVGTDGLLEGAAALQGFPKDRRDKREIVFGSAGPKFAGGSVRLEFYCKDLAGHTAFRAVIEDDYGQQELTQSAMVFIDFDPAALDQFLVELQQVEREHRGSASLITGARYNSGKLLVQVVCGKFGRLDLRTFRNPVYRHFAFGACETLSSTAINLT